MPDYLFTPHARACLVGDNIVFLDLRTATYVGLRGCSVPPLLAVLEEHSRAVQPDGAQHVTLDADVASSLVARGLLIASGNPGVPIAPASVERPHTALGQWHGEELPARRMVDCLHFARAALAAQRLLRRRSLELLIDRITKRRARAGEEERGLDVEAARKWTLVYRRLRPWWPPVRAPDLFDSVALVEFLSMRSLCARIVWGVKAVPFETHAWVQQDGYVLNDTPEYVARYTPILLI